MGGIPCLVDRQAILRFQTVPTTPPEQAQFDEQIRRLYVAVAQSIADDAPAQAQEVCGILAQPEFSQANRQRLLDVIESLYNPSY